MGNETHSLAIARIHSLLDADSFVEIGGLVTARNTDFNLADTVQPKEILCMYTARMFPC